MQLTIKFTDNTEHTITLTDGLIREVESLLYEREYNGDLSNIVRQKEEIISHIRYNLLPDSFTHKQFAGQEDEDIIFPLEDLVSASEN
jgi:hypothetical protein